MRIGAGLARWRRLRDRDDFVAEPKNVWNTLEVAKLTVSTATPLMIFAVGAFLSHQSARQAEHQQILAAKAAAKREIADNARQVRLASMTYLVGKRAKILDEILPAIEEINNFAVRSCQSVFLEKDKTKWAIYAAERSNLLSSKLAINKVYFSESFYFQEVVFLSLSDNVRTMALNKEVWTATHGTLCPHATEAYNNLMVAIPKELGLTDPQKAELPGSKFR
ncbi:hypothetical protein [Sphingomonas sp. Leaf62]|uniref:hypothetical protein n=1 Tax=Sphingomonas sp. Leaf62 TaxID=1736228 RepID=UPI000A9D48A7|nr:hypothetical protein [Sphingomonas sp. Leaf62]